MISVRVADPDDVVKNLSLLLILCCSLLNIKLVLNEVISEDLEDEVEW